MKLKKILLLPIGLVLGIAGCANVPFSTYHMATTSFNYDPRYVSSDVEANGRMMGGGYGGGIYTNDIKVGPQIITWKDAATGQRHKSTNEVMIHRDQLKGKKYIAFHLYPDDTVEVTTSNDWPDPTEKGAQIRKQLKPERLLLEATAADNLIYYLKLKNAFLIDGMSDLELYEFVVETLPKAQKYGLSGTRDLLNFICLKLLYQEKFDTDEKLQSLLSDLKNKHISMDDIMLKLAKG